MKKRTHTCPWWFGYSFDNPVRCLVHEPRTILGDFVESGLRAEGGRPP